MSKKPRLSKEKRKEMFKRRVFIWSFLGIPILSFLLFYVYVNFNSIVMAFQRPVYGGETEYIWSTANFTRIKELFSSTGDGVLLEALINTLTMWATGMLIGLPLSILACYFFYVKIPGTKLFRAVMYLPQIITSSALVVLFKYAIGQGGPLDLIMAAGGQEYINPLTTSPSAMTTIIFYSVSFGFGTNIILIGSAMNSILRQCSGVFRRCSHFPAPHFGTVRDFPEHHYGGSPFRRPEGLIRYTYIHLQKRREFHYESEHEKNRSTVTDCCDGIACNCRLQQEE